MTCRPWDITPVGPAGAPSYPRCILCHVASKRYIIEHDLMANAERLGTTCLKRMRAMMQRHQLIGDVRGIGLLLGIELVTDRDTKARVRLTSFASNRDLLWPFAWPTHPQCTWEQARCRTGVQYVGNDRML